MIVEALVRDPDVMYSPDAVQSTKRFGSSALKINGKIFAMLVHGKLVVKLSRPRVDELIAAGDGERFDPGHGRLMKEWLTVGSMPGDGWLLLAKEAMEFVGARQ